MFEFLNNQRADVLKELTKLYEQRRNAGVESIGGIKNRIENVKEELDILDKEIAAIGKIPKSAPPIISNPNNLDAIKSEIMTLIADGEFEEAIELMQKTWDKTDLILLSARFNQLKSRYNKGIIASSEYNIESNKITLSLLETLKKL
jgi:hypothetical protein